MAIAGSTRVETVLQFRFRPLTDDDLPLMHRWLNEPGVVQWWEDDDVSWEGVVNDYGSGHGDPVEHWICSVCGIDPEVAGRLNVDGSGFVAAGWIQNYKVADFAQVSELWATVDAVEGAVGIDYLIGEPALRGLGVGSGMIAAFAHFIFCRPNPPPQLASDPTAANVASWRALEKAGFRLGGTVHDAELGEHRIMLLDRPN
jgi:aminoglycoside 6'-N-acetyltransferase